jgi:soluble P-type ATPase
MIEIEIPGFGLLKLQHFVSDFSGTLSADGKLLPGVGERLNRITGILKVHILTADTFGMAQEELLDIKCALQILNGNRHDVQKEEYVKKLGAESVAAFGNGNNDRKMLQAAKVGIAVTENEGCAVDGLDLLLNPKRLTATLRF